MATDDVGRDPLEGVGLLFVYNADSGVMNALRDYVHKVVSPATYECNLCALTYGNLGMRREWADLIDGLGVPVGFLHKDELRDGHGVDGVPLPAVLLRRAGGMSVLIPAEEIDGLRSLEELEDLVSARVEGLRGRRSHD
jgi:hypothetical protein